MCLGGGGGASCFTSHAKEDSAVMAAGSEEIIVHNLYGLHFGTKTKKWICSLHTLTICFDF